MGRLNKRRLGADKEDFAASYLEEKGLRVIEKNFRCRIGEIDLIARDREYLVFIEVKYRRNAELGSPQEAVGIAKQRTICKVADYYRLKNGIGNTQSVRYDVVAIMGNEISWIPNAFLHHYSGNR